MKDCEVFRKGLCLGCVGLAEKDWCGAEYCQYYKQIKAKQKFKTMEGQQEKIKL